MDRVKREDYNSFSRRVRQRVVDCECRETAYVLVRVCVCVFFVGRVGFVFRGLVVDCGWHQHEDEVRYKTNGQSF